MFVADLTCSSTPAAPPAANRRGSNHPFRAAFHLACSHLYNGFKDIFPTDLAVSSGLQVLARGTENSARPVSLDPLAARVHALVPAWTAHPDGWSDRLADFSQALLRGVQENVRQGLTQHFAPLASVVSGIGAPAGLDGHAAELSAAAQDINSSSAALVASAQRIKQHVCLQEPPRISAEELLNGFVAAVADTVQGLRVNEEQRTSVRQRHRQARVDFHRTFSNANARRRAVLTALHELERLIPDDEPPRSSLRQSVAQIIQQPFPFGSSALSFNTAAVAGEQPVKLDSSDWTGRFLSQPQALAGRDLARAMASELEKRALGQLSEEMKRVRGSWEQLTSFIRKEDEQLDAFLQGHLLPMILTFDKLQLRAPRQAREQIREQLGNIEREMELEEILVATDGSAAWNPALHWIEEERPSQLPYRSVIEVTQRGFRRRNRIVLQVHVILSLGLSSASQHSYP